MRESGNETKILPVDVEQVRFTEEFVISETTASTVFFLPSERSEGIVRVNSILPACASGRGRAPLFLLRNHRRARSDSAPKMAYTYLP
jgi:hypothetical protein